ncbi:Alginate biosynthesis protein AlgA [Salinivirga cyanobacteriivorans]|uniref:mannose-1-phosphate guanylyltransferase n=1 Tax=Salinivirga cyanobacteriivorans TaxID=1307839 RepID=A0A0S2I187_9BACT|nr:mannose-1-phosphate guanylyltransferase [Salinivirga cyanobacteriivorans]ALO16080.1 Alginate biosynthesis protein AlgA [Salinivirga cyanobacteriivorans]
MNNNLFCVIMAGGIDRRFWPLSRQNRPKQFIDLLDTGSTLLQMTYNRMAKVCPRENILIVTGFLFKDLVQEQIPEINDSQILIEPTRRNTAPCVAFANERIRAINPEASIIVTPADHLILNEDKFVKVINDGITFIEKEDALLSIGINPSRAETNYGYIQIEDTSQNEGIVKVKNFTEKPDKELAKFFIESGEFFWNAGIYIWKLKDITSAFELHLPEIQELFAENREAYNTDEEENFISRIYSGCKNISIDYGIMEKAENVYVYCANFGWSDLGTWSNLFDNKEKDDDHNVTNHQNILTYDTHNTLITTTDNKITAIQGLEDYVVAETYDSLLICKRSEEDKIREIVNDIKFKKGEENI